ncbi:cytochrome c-like [Bos mutus]|uniref:cytochrome c-like n=1 Tax=Bos mutus TaxID=72004 RepID=UPI0038B6790F
MGDVETCAQCCTAEKRGEHKTGPSPSVCSGKRQLAASLRQTSAGKRISWGEETLVGYLENPRSSIPGTKVTFADIQEGERGDLTAYFKKATNE